MMLVCHIRGFLRHCGLDSEQETRRGSSSKDEVQIKRRGRRKPSVTTKWQDVYVTLSTDEDESPTKASHKDNYTLHGKNAYAFLPTPLVCKVADIAVLLSIAPTGHYIYIYIYRIEWQDRK
ncbi:unnamed protein product [Musa acuminata subsp. burmannicoides]